MSEHVPDVVLEFALDLQPIHDTMWGLSYHLDQFARDVQAGRMGAGADTRRLQKELEALANAAARFASRLSDAGHACPHPTDKRQELDGQTACQECGRLLPLG